MYLYFIYIFWALIPVYITSSWPDQTGALSHHFSHSLSPFLIVPFTLIAPFIFGSDMPSALGLVHSVYCSRKLSFVYIKPGQNPPPHLCGQPAKKLHCSKFVFLPVFGFCLFTWHSLGPSTLLARVAKKIPPLPICVSPSPTEANASVICCHCHCYLLFQILTFLVTEGSLMAKGLHQGLLGTIK